MDTTQPKQNGFIVVLRWLAVLPASISTFLFAFVANAFVQKFFSEGEGAFSNFIQTISVGLIAGGAFILAGAYTAPSARKLATGIVLIVLLSAITGGLFLTGIIIHEETKLLVQYGTQLVGILGGAGIALFMLHEDDQKVRS